MDSSSIRIGSSPSPTRGNRRNSIHDSSKPGPSDASPNGRALDHHGPSLPLSVFQCRLSVSGYPIVVHCIVTAHRSQSSGFVA